MRSNIPPLKSVCTAGFHAAKNMFTWRCSYIHYVSLPLCETSLIILLIKPYMRLFGMLENMTIPTFKTWHCEGEFKMYSYYHLLGNSIHICKIKRSSIKEILHVYIIYIYIYMYNHTTKDHIQQQISDVSTFAVTKQCCAFFFFKAD